MYAYPYWFKAETVSKNLLKQNYVKLTLLLTHCEGVFSASISTRSKLVSIGQCRCYQKLLNPGPKIHCWSSLILSVTGESLRLSRWQPNSNSRRTGSTRHSAVVWHQYRSIPRDDASTHKSTPTSIRLLVTLFISGIYYPRYWSASHILDCCWMRLDHNEWA